MRNLKARMFCGVLAVSVSLSGTPLYAADPVQEDAVLSYSPALSGFTETWIYAGETWDASSGRNRIFADDQEDGDLTQQIVRTGTVDTNTPGRYSLTYTVTDQDGNTSSMDAVVNVLERGNADGRTVQRTLYTLPDASHLSNIGFNRGYHHDRQGLGIWLPAGESLQIRLVNAKEFGTNLEIGFYNDDQEKENREQIPASGDWVTLSNTHGEDSVPFIKTPKNILVQPVVEFQWTDQMQEVPYYRYQDDQESFFEAWDASNAPFAVVEGVAATFLAPLKDKDNIINSPYTGTPEYRFQSLDEWLEWYAAFVAQYDAYAGLSFKAAEPWNQNVRARFFIKANKHGAGAAYYSGDHSATNSDSLEAYLTRSWLALHEFGHGYEGAIATQEHSFVETTNNIMGYYFEQTYRPDSEFGWLLGSFQGATAKERLSNLEQRALERRTQTHSFNDIVEGAQHYQVSLYMFVNALDRLGPQKTVSNMHASYRKYHYETGKMRTASDAVLESFCESGYNMIPYFETYHIAPSRKLENKIYEADRPILYYLYDLIPDAALAEQVRAERNLPGVYSLVEPDDLADFGYMSQVKFQIAIDDIDQIRGKEIRIKNGGRIVKRLPVTSKTIQTEIPVGAYEVEIPAPNALSYSYGNQYLIAKKGSVTQEITYKKETGNLLADAMQLMLKGIGNNTFATISVDTSAEKLIWRTMRAQPHYGIEGTYATIRVYNPQGEEIYSRSIAGPEQLSEEERDFSFPTGSRLVVEHCEGASRLLMKHEDLEENAPGFSAVSGENAYVMTEYGLMKEAWGESEWEEAYLSCLKQYTEKLADEINGALLNDPEKYTREKLFIQNACERLSEESLQKYDQEWGIFRGKDTASIYVKIPSDTLRGSADSEAGKGSDGLADAALDGDEATYWHSNYSGNREADFEKDSNNCYTITLSQNTDVGKLVYVPRPGAGNGTILACDVSYSETSDGNDFIPLSHETVAWENVSAAKTLEFDAKHAKRIRIHVTDAFSNNSKDLISAAEFYLYEKREIRSDGADIYLGSLSEGLLSEGSKALQKNQNGNGGEISLTVNGAPKTFAQGIGMLAHSSVTYRLNGKNFDVFAACVGVENAEAPGKTAEFFVYGDGALLYASGEMQSGKEARFLYLDITGVSELSLEVKGEDGTAVSLGNARFYLTEDKEELTLIVGETARVTSNSSLDLSALASMRWESDQEAVASVDASGNITATGVGDAVISAFGETEEENKTFSVHVKEKKDIYPEWTDRPNQPENPGQPGGPGPSGDSDAVDVAVTPAKTTGLAIGDNQVNALTLSWTAVAGADAYEIYRAKKDGGDFEKVAEVKEPAYTDAGLLTGTSYRYKVVACAQNSGRKGEASDEVWSTTQPSKCTLKKVKRAGTKATLLWKKNKQAEKYEIWMKEKKKFQKVKTVSGKKASVKISKLKRGKTYQFRIRAYRMDGAGNKIYGAFSKNKKIKM